MTAASPCWVRMPVLMVVLASPSLMMAWAGGGRGSPLALANFEVVGIRIGDVVDGKEIDDVKRVLGPAAVKVAKNGVESSFCYSPAAADGTVLEFRSYYQQITGFLIYRPSASPPHGCSKSTMVTPWISTASGLKLGMTRNDAIRTIGTPTSKSDRLVIFKSSYKRAATPDEIKRTARPDQSSPPSPDINFYEEIKLRLMHGKVVEVQVSRTFQWWEQ